MVKHCIVLKSLNVIYMFSLCKLTRYFHFVSITRCRCLNLKANRVILGLYQQFIIESFLKFIIVVNLQTETNGHDIKLVKNGIECVCVL